MKQTVNSVCFSDHLFIVYMQRKTNAIETSIETIIPMTKGRFKCLQFDLAQLQMRLALFLAPYPVYSEQFMLFKTDSFVFPDT